MTRRAGLGIDLPRSCFTREQFSPAVYNGFLGAIRVRRDFPKLRLRSSLISPLLSSLHPPPLPLSPWSCPQFNDNSPRRISINAFERNRYRCSAAPFPSPFRMIFKCIPGRCFFGAKQLAVLRVHLRRRAFNVFPLRE